MLIREALVVQNVQFLDVLNRMIPAPQFEQLCEEYAPRARSAPKLTAPQLISGLIYHQLQEGGTLAASSGRLHGIRMSDSAHTQRRQLLPVELFKQMLRAALCPLADSKLHPQSFFRRARSCPRVLRQPVSSWPCKTDQPSRTGSVQIKVLPL